MKLLFCSSCFDIIKLFNEERSCLCGKVKGRYLEDGHHAEYAGEGAVPMGMDSREFVQALKKWPNWHVHRGLRFDAFLVTRGTKTYRNLDSPDEKPIEDIETRQMADREKLTQEMISELIRNGVIQDP